MNVIYGGGDVGEWLVTDPDVNAIAFVGSHGTAEKIVRAAGLKRTLMEASGNGPVVVCADADLELAAKGAVYGAFYCAGQVCSATERVLVDRRVQDEFLEAVVREAEGWKLGDPFDDETLVGPMQNEPTAQKMDEHLEDAVGKGAEVVVGGSRGDGRPTGLYYQPTVVDQRGPRHAREPRRDLRADRPADLRGRRRRRARGCERVAPRAPGGRLHA